MALNRPQGTSGSEGKVTKSYRLGALGFTPKSRILPGTREPESRPPHGPDPSFRVITSPTRYPLGYL
jgi:hypothetical protein